MTEDALDYLPSDMSKADRVLHGLKALRDGVPYAPGQRQLPADSTKLKAVASALAEALEEFGVPGAKLPDFEAGASPVRASEVAAEMPLASKAPGEGSEVGAKVAVDPDGPIFIVHGHDQALRHEAVRVLERSTRRDVVVLHEQPNAGRTLLEKFEEHAAGAAYAVVLLTGDDVGGASGTKAKPRGRQNVIFELGFFFGKLGRQRVAVLLSPGVEPPSDVSGLVYIAVDEGTWKFKLARELEAAGLPVDYARIP